MAIQLQEMGVQVPPPAPLYFFSFTYSSFLGLPTLFIEDIFVLEVYRKQGIGKKCLTFV